MIKVIKLLKLACTPLRHWDLITFVLVGLTPAFIHRYWYLVAVNWGDRDTSLYRFLFKISNCLTLEQSNSRRFDIMNICPTFACRSIHIIGIAVQLHVLLNRTCTLFYISLSNVKLWVVFYHSESFLRVYNNNIILIIYNN